MYRKILHLFLVGAVATAVVFLWGPDLQAVNMMREYCPPAGPTPVPTPVPYPGVTRTVLGTFASPGMPGISRTCLKRTEYKPGAKANFALEAKVGDLCNITLGQLSVTFQGQKTEVYHAGNAFLARPSTKGTVFNSGGSTAVEYCWDIEFR